MLNDLGLCGVLDGMLDGPSRCIRQSMCWWVKQFMGVYIFKCLLL